jgi:hypothetical protein
MPYKFKTEIKPKDVPWVHMIQILDIVGMRQFSRIMPQQDAYTFRESVNLDNTMDYIITCDHSRSYFEFGQDWKGHYSDLDDTFRIVNRRPVEGQLASALPYIEKLLDLGVISLEETKSTNTHTHKQLIHA